MHCILFYSNSIQYLFYILSLLIYSPLLLLLPLLFYSLSKEIEFWRERSTTLASQLAETDRSYSSKIELVLAEQGHLSEQQQQVLKDLSTALATQQALATALTGGGVGLGNNTTSTATTTTSPTTGTAALAIPTVPSFSPEQVLSRLLASSLYILIYIYIYMQLSFMLLSLTLTYYIVFYQYPSLIIAVKRER